MEKKMTWFVLSTDRMLHWSMRCATHSLVKTTHRTARWNDVDGKFTIQWVEMTENLKRGNPGRSSSYKRHVVRKKPLANLIATVMPGHS